MPVCVTGAIEREGAYYGDEPSNQHAHRVRQTQVVGTAFGAAVSTRIRIVVPITLTPEDADRTFDDVTARLELDYRVNDDLLVFASYNRGSKSGGFSFSTGTPFADLRPRCSRAARHGRAVPERHSLRSRGR